MFSLINYLCNSFLPTTRGYSSGECNLQSAYFPVEVCFSQLFCFPLQHLSIQLWSLPYKIKPDNSDLYWRVCRWSGVQIFTANNCVQWQRWKRKQGVISYIERYNYINHKYTTASDSYKSVFKNLLQYRALLMWVLSLYIHTYQENYQDWKHSLERYCTLSWLSIIHYVYLQESFSISDGFDGSAISYIINYTDVTSGVVCASVTVSASSCMDNILCEHDLRLAFTPCISSSQITVTARGANLLGEGLPSAPVSIRGITTTLLCVFFFTNLLLGFSTNESDSLIGQLA